MSRSLIPLNVLSILIGTQVSNRNVDTRLETDDAKSILLYVPTIDVTETIGLAVSFDGITFVPVTYPNTKTPNITFVTADGNKAFPINFIPLGMFWQLTCSVPAVAQRDFKIVKEVIATGGLS